MDTEVRLPVAPAARAVTPVDVVRAMTALGDTYCRKGDVTRAASVYDQAINLGRTSDCLPGVRMAADAAIEMAFEQLGGDASALDYARQVSVELLLTIDGTRDDGVQHLGEVVQRAVGRYPSILRKCLEAVQTACTRERTAGHDIPASLVALDERLSSTVRGFRTAAPVG